MHAYRNQCCFFSTPSRDLIPTCDHGIDHARVHAYVRTTTVYKLYTWYSNNYLIPGIPNSTIFQSTSGIYIYIILYIYIYIYWAPVAPTGTTIWIPLEFWVTSDTTMYYSAGISSWHTPALQSKTTTATIQQQNAPVPGPAPVSKKGCKQQAPHHQAKNAAKQARRPSPRSER